MLSHEDNLRYMNAEPGWPLHDMGKRYWVPYLRAETLEANGAPHKVELFGEKYICFRATDGRLGFFDEQCPHRGASLHLARNGDNALTCIFHGWKFDVAGHCVATPTESNPDFCKHVKLKAYPVREAGGVCWVYLGPGEPPVFPDYEFFHAPPTHRRARVGYTESNWTQNIETLLDSAHIGVLHANLASGSQGPASAVAIHGITAPELKVVPTPYGFQAYSQRRRPDGTSYLRVTEWVAPFTVLNGATRDTEEGRLLMIVPINNRRTAFWRMEWDFNHDQAWWRDKYSRQGLLSMYMPDPDDFISPLLDRSDPRLGQQRDAMNLNNWSGFNNLIAEDLAVAESVPIIDRTRENLGASDLVIARMRRQLLDGLKAFAGGSRPYGLGPEGNGTGIPYRDLRGTAEVIAADEDAIRFHNETLREERSRTRASFGVPA
ncbi:MAG TPA: Rieske 2Fe-2S domain-containing protein [Ramlibacter sp.]|nr:Rieske 2Fe-2S domain-containing protein [Ramlibacter sp.]